MQTVNKVAINTTFQYFQLFMSVVLGLLTVRIVLNSLGDVDYGIYNLVAGLIGLLTFMSISLSQTSIRFISVDIGNGNNEIIRKTFASCFTLHFVMAIGILVCLELIGVFALGSLNIPEERLSASKLVYNFMLVSLFFSLIATPFQSIIIAYEHFVFSSIWGIMDAMIKLLIAYYISISSGDKLIIYGILMAVLVIIDFVVYYSYSRHYFGDNIKLKADKFSEVKSVAGFAGWTLCDVFSSVVNRQGYAVLFNYFFGPLMNTVYALASQVESHLYTVSASVINTMKPQIMKSVGAGDDTRALRLSITAGKFGFLMMAVVSVPLLVMMPEILRLWLKEFPEDTIFFARIMVLASMFEQLTRGLVYANQAFGNIKKFALIVSSIRVAAMPVSLICLLFGSNYYIPIVLFLVFESLGSLARVVVMNRLYGFKVYNFIKQLCLQVLPPFAVSFVICHFIYRCIPGLIGMALAFLVTVLSYLIMAYLWGMTNAEKESVSIIAKSFIKKI